MKTKKSDLKAKLKRNALTRKPPNHKSLSFVNMLKYYRQVFTNKMISFKSN